MASKKIKCKGSDDAGKLIRENMKCPVCMEVLLPPIYQCETGHNICYLCVDEVTECPLCKGDYGDTRNYFAEELVNSMSFPCKFEDYGCVKILPGSELKDHQDTCEFQPYRCPELACQEVAGLHQMGKHLDRHGFKVMKGDVQEASIDIQDDHFDRKTEYNPWRISAFNREFYTVSTRQKDGTWYFWSYCLGLSKDTKKFSYEIMVFCDDKQILYRGLVHSLRIEPDDIMSQGNCLTLKDSIVKSLRKNGKISCRVRFIQGRNWDVKTEKPKKLSAAAKAAAATKDVKVYKGKIRIPSTPPSTAASPSDSSSLFMLTAVTPLRALKAKLNTGGRLPPIPPPTPTSAKREALSSVKGNVKDIPVASSSSRTLKKSNHVHAKISDEEQNFVSKMRDTLRCPGCSETISPPVHQCVIGHNICYNCKLSRSDCAVCRAPIGNSRNFFAEELLYKVYQRCSYAPKGCKVVLPSAQMRSHETSCEFAPFDCPFNACRQLIAPPDLFEHLKSHQITVMNNELKTQIEVPKAYPVGGSVCTIPHILFSHNTAFYPIIVRQTDGAWTFSISTQDHNKFRFEVTLEKMSKTLSFQGPVLSLRMNQTEYSQNGLSLVVPETMVNSLKYDGRLSYSMKIFSCSERIPTNSMFAFHACLNLKRGPLTLTGQTELFANKKTSVSAEDEDDADEAGTGNEGDDSETRLSELYDAESDERLDVFEAVAEAVAKNIPQCFTIIVNPEPGKEIEEIKSIVQSLDKNSTTASRVSSEVETFMKLGKPNFLNHRKSVPAINPENQLTVATSELVGQDQVNASMKKQKQTVGGRKRSKSRPKPQTGQSSSSTTVGKTTYSQKATEEPKACTRKSDTVIKMDKEIASINSTNGIAADSPQEKDAVLEEIGPMVKSSHSIGVGDNSVHISVIGTQTLDTIRESRQIGTSSTNLTVSCQTVAADAEYYDLELPKGMQPGSLLSTKNVDQVVEMLSDGVNEMTEVITDGFNAVKSVVDMNAIADGLYAVKSVVDSVGNRLMTDANNSTGWEKEDESRIPMKSDSQTSNDDEVD